MPALKKDGTPRKTPVRRPVVPLWQKQPIPHNDQGYEQPPGTDVWWCVGCGARYCFRRVIPGKRGGPHQRLIDRRYGIYSCWRALKEITKVKRKVVEGKRYHEKGARVILAADGAPVPGQPDQDPELLAMLKLA
jgi:hypothetical protein